MPEITLHDLLTRVLSQYLNLEAFMVVCRLERLTFLSIFPSFTLASTNATRPSCTPVHSSVVTHGMPYKPRWIPQIHKFRSMKSTTRPTSHLSSVHPDLPPMTTTPTSSPSSPIPSFCTFEVRDVQINAVLVLEHGV